MVTILIKLREATVSIRKNQDLLYYLNTDEKGIFKTEEAKIKFRINTDQNSRVKNQTIQLENGQKIGTFHQRGYTDGKEANEEIFNIR